jgi:hypothetical protein
MKALHSPEVMAKFNLAMTVLWSLLLIPTVIWWKDSLLWVLIMSAYANIVGHWSAYQGSRAGVEAERNGDTDSKDAVRVSPPRGANPPPSLQP